MIDIKDMSVNELLEKYEVSLLLTYGEEVQTSAFPDWMHDLHVVREEVRRRLIKASGE